MRPYKYTKTKNSIILHYKFSDLRKFIERGKLYGDNGWIIISKIGNLIKYKGFGTIEHPLKEIMTISIEHCEAYDGEFDEDKIINPPVIRCDHSRYKFICLDFNKL